MNNSKFTFIDLFSGIGGFRMALNSLGGDCLNFSEINNDAINTYCTNFNEEIDYNLGDITKIKTLPKHDLLTGGVPCQSWSIAGKNLGFDDDRGQLWNDTLYLLHQSKPKAFIFENVKGLVDPRNKAAFAYILERIKEAGYFANYYLLNSYDYGVPQNRLRIYIVGFREKAFAAKFKLPKPINIKTQLSDILSHFNTDSNAEIKADFNPKLMGEKVDKKPKSTELNAQRSMSLSSNNGLNDYFLFNDLRNGHSTIHSWDILETTERQKSICYLLLKNRRKSAYGNMDGNPLSIKHLQSLDPSVKQAELDDLIKMDILKIEYFSFLINKFNAEKANEKELELLKYHEDNYLNMDVLKSNRDLKLKGISISKTIKTLLEKNIITGKEIRYEFKNTKISTGLFGINRIFLPTSNIFPTLVASDTNDYITLKNIDAKNEDDYKAQFIEDVYKKDNYRKITKREACLIQGFPMDFILPENRSRWMKLLGNSVSVPVIETLGKAIVETGVFDAEEAVDIMENHEKMALKS